jgi:hypothetical protein
MIGIAFKMNYELVVTTNKFRSSICNVLRRCNLFLLKHRK